MSTAYLSRLSVEDCGLEVVGVGSGVRLACLGDGASALALRDPERGVMLGLAKFFAGVEALSFITPPSPGEKVLSSLWELCEPLAALDPDCLAYGFT